MQPPHEFKPNLILLPHPLTTEGREVEYAAIRRNDTLASFLRRNEILPAPTAPIRVVVNGEYIPAAEWRKRRLSVGDHIEMRSMAQGSFGRIIGMIVIAIAAVKVGGLAAMAYTGTTSTAAAVAAGGGMVMAGVAAAVNILGGMLLNAVLPAQQEQTGKYGSATSSPTYSLSGSSNSLRRYEPMPLVLGRHKVVPDLTGRPYTELVGNDMYLYQGFHFGLQSDLEISEVKIGETLASTYEEYSSQFSGSDGRLSLIAGNVDSEDGKELTAEEGWVTRTSALNTTRLAVDLAVQAFYVNDGSGYDNRSIEFELAYAPAGSSNWQSFSSGDKTHYHDNYWSFGYFSTDDNGNQEWRQTSFDYSFDTGAHNPAQVLDAEGNPATPVIDDNGQEYYPGTRYVWRWRPYSEIDPNHTNDVGGMAPSRLYYVTADGYASISGSGSDTVRKTFWMDVPEGQYDLRVRRTTPKSDNTRTTLVSSIMQFRFYQTDTADYSGQCRMAVKIKATAQLNGALDNVSAVVSAKCPVWVDTSVEATPGLFIRDLYRGWVTLATSNPAWWFLWFARGKYDPSGRRMYGAGLPDSQIDIDQIIRWARFCDANQLTINKVLDQSASVAQVLDAIAQCGFATKGWPEGRLSVTWSVKNQPPVGLFTPDNIKSSSFEVSWLGSDDLADEIVVNYVDPTTWETAQVRQMVPGVTQPRNSTTIDFDGCTSKEMAGKYANLKAASQALHRRIISWETDVEGLLVRRGDVVRFSHDITQWSYAGRLLGGSHEGITLDKPVPMSASGGWVLLRLPNGRSVTRKVLGGEGESDTLTFVEPLPASDADGVIEMPSDGGTSLDWLWCYDPVSETPGLRLLVTGVQPADYNSVRITAVDDSDSYYDAINNVYEVLSSPSLKSNTYRVTHIQAWAGAFDVTTGKVPITCSWVLDRDCPVKVDCWVNGVPAPASVGSREAVVLSPIGAVVTFRVTPTPMAIVPVTPKTVTIQTPQPEIPLPDVTGLVVTTAANGDDVVASWQAVDKATHYLVEVWSGSTLARSETLGDALSYTYTLDKNKSDGPVKASVTIKVRAAWVNGYSLNWAYGTSDLAVPAAPFPVLEEAFVGSVLRVRWDAVPNAQSYEWRVSPPAAPALRQGNVAGVTRFEYDVESMRTAGTLSRVLHVEVRSVSAAGLTSGWASLTASNPAPAVPTGLRITSGFGFITMSWDPSPDTDIAGYVVHLSAEENFTPLPSNQINDDTSASATTFSLPSGADFVIGTTYYMRVAGYDLFGKDQLNYSGALPILFSAIPQQLVDLQNLGPDKFTPEVAEAISKAQTIDEELQQYAVDHLYALAAQGEEIAERRKTTAEVKKETLIRATETKALAADVTTLKTSVGENTTSIGSIMESVDGVRARWGVSITQDVNGAKKVSGVQLIGDGTSSAFDVLADVFRVSMPDKTGSKQVFTAGLINGVGTVGISGDLLVDGTITGRSLVANTVTAEKIDSRGLSIKDANGNVILASGTSLDWGRVGGSGKPADNATVGATFGVNVGGQITPANASTYIASAAINNAMIANLSADKINTGYLAAGRIALGTYSGNSASNLDLNTLYIDPSNSGQYTCTQVGPSLTLSGGYMEKHASGMFKVYLNTARSAHAVVTMTADLSIYRGGALVNGIGWTQDSRYAYPGAPSVCFPLAINTIDDSLAPGTYTSELTVYVETLTIEGSPISGSMVAIDFGGHLSLREIKI